MSDITIKCLSGRAIEPYLSDLARLRIEVFRDFPYLYDGTQEYEEKYLRTYVNSPDSVVVLAYDGDTAVGASTGLPMADETEEFQQPFVDAGYDPQRIFYCAESVLLKSHRGKGIYKHFFDGREGHARKLGRFDWCTFCCVQRPENHPLRPADYAPLDPIWSKFGYVKHPELVTHYTWKDVGETEETAKPMVFWLKPLKEST
ncbi:GNAT family N-acetyltransferase [Methylogaea oryzae]|uniref:GNAT family acetyltransferase n=2 Tax=Methylogaea oryzae TaxID=1295382 RepID=A0A8D4VLS4_9GAMM|nr:GNAT family N-acetyltransferase [Methylogaea oryzae]BBL69594.1 GNAT family acetyltransferase [Methylogaea oryzae]